MRRVSKFENALLTVGAVLGSLCLLIVVAGMLFGIKPLIFESGSMEPSIPTGGLALSVPVHAHEVRVGDIVSTENSAGARITHRVAAVEPGDGYAQLTLKGDANDVVDVEVYAVTEVDRVFWSAPLLGYVVAWLSSRFALFLPGLLTAYLLYVAFASGSRRDARGGSTSDDSARRSGRRAHRRRRRHARSRIVGMTLTSGLILTSVILNPGERAWAQFSDSEAAQPRFSAGTLAAPVVACNDADGGVILKWNYEALPTAPTFAITWSTDDKVPKSEWNNLTTVTGKEVKISASTFDSGVVALGGSTPRYLHVRALKGGWYSPDGFVVATTYTAPLKLIASVTPSSLTCNKA